VPLPQIKPKREISISNVKEKIHLEKQLPFRPNDKVGPTLDLYFHELRPEKSTGQKILTFLCTLGLSLIFFLSYPFIALLIKLTSKEPVISQKKVLGRRGTSFPLYSYTTKYSNSDNSLPGGRFLRKYGLDRLPSVINLWKQELTLVGPKPYPERYCNSWNKELSDYYKRFAMKPGYFHVADLITSPENIDEVADSLDEEFQFLLKTSFKYDLTYLLGLRHD